MRRKYFSGKMYPLLGIALVIVLSLSRSISAQESMPPFVEGQDFFRVEHKVVDQVIELESLHQVVDIEIYYWYGSAVCWEVEKALMEYHQQNPQLTYMRTPLVAYQSWRPQAYLQPIMANLSKQLEMPDIDTLYENCLNDCSVFNSYESIKSWLMSRANVKELPFFDESEIWLAEKNYRKRADSFSIRQVPTIIIRETYRVDANSAKSSERLMQIIDYLLNLNS